MVYIMFPENYLSLPQIIFYMEEKSNIKHGGKRVGAGRHPKSDSKKQIAMKLDNDLYTVFKALPFSQKFDDGGINRGRYINDAIREKMERDGYINANIHPIK